MSSLSFPCRKADTASIWWINISSFCTAKANNDRIEEKRTTGDNVFFIVYTVFLCIALCHETPFETLNFAIAGVLHFKDPLASDWLSSTWQFNELPRVIGYKRLIFRISCCFLLFHLIAFQRFVNGLWFKDVAYVVSCVTNLFFCCHIDKLVHSVSNWWWSLSL